MNNSYKEYASKEYVDSKSGTIKSTSITLSASAWSTSSSPYSQSMRLEGVTPTSKIDLCPSLDQIEELQETEITLTAVNVDGEVYVYAFGNKPTNDYTMQALITEVVSV